MKRNLLRLLNLFYNKTSVTRKEISDTCEVTERSTYRYMNMLSESGFSVYYDRSSGAYKLIKPSTIDANVLSVSEAILIKIALIELLPKLESHYKTQIDSIDDLLERIHPDITKFSAKTSSSTNKEIANVSSLPELLTKSLVIYATAKDRKLSLVLRVDRENKKKRIINKPAIKFKDDWFVTDKKFKANEDYKMSDILEARII